MRPVSPRLHRRSRGRVAVAGAALAACAMAAAAGPAAAATPSSFRLDMHFGADPFIDVGEPGPSLGDLRVLDDALYRGGRRVGRDGGSCVITNANRPEAACTITFSLPHGIITGQWLNQPPPRKVVAITGGTGRYRSARGEVVVVEHSTDRGTATFRLVDAPNRL